MTLFSAILAVGGTTLAQEGPIIRSSTYLLRDGNKFPWKLILEKEYQIDDPEKKILIIYIHGSATDDLNEPYCNFANRLLPVSDLSGRQLQGKEIIVYISCTNHLSGDFRVRDGQDFPEEYLCNFEKRPSCEARPYKEFKRRVAILNTVDGFIARGIPARQIFLMGHSCGGWQSLMLAAQHPNKINGSIALDPGCYGSPSWQKDKPRYKRLQQFEISVMRQASTIPAIVFSNESSSCCFPSTLDWLKDVRLAEIISTPKSKGGFFEVNGDRCFLQDERGKKLSPIKDGHRLNYSPCFMFYNEQIMKFIERQL